MHYVHGSEDKIISVCFKSHWIPGSSLVVQGVGALTLWVQSLVWEVNSHRLHSMAKKKKKESVDSLSNSQKAW